MREYSFWRLLDSHSVRGLVVPGVGWLSRSLSPILVLAHRQQTHGLASPFPSWQSQITAVLAILLQLLRMARRAGL
jgi:hypothetical protein